MEYVKLRINYLKLKLNWIKSLLSDLFLIDYRMIIVNLELQVKDISYEDLFARLIDEEKYITRAGILKNEI